MWRWLLIPLAAVSAASAAETSSGPAYPAEAAILWKDGKAAYEKGDFQQAVNLLARLADRYPGSPGHLESHLLLGQSWLSLGEPKKALAPLKYYVHAASRAGESPASVEGRIGLGRAYLELKKFNEAVITSKEIEKAAGKLPTGPAREPFLSHALMIRTRAWIGLNRDDRAQRILSSSRPHLASSVRGEASFLDLELKLRSCEKLPNRGPLSEAHVRSQLERRGSCLLEALLLLRKSLELGEAEWARQAADALEGAFRRFVQVSGNPPAPPEPGAEGGKRRRTAAELKSYKQELAQLLLEDAGVKISQAREFLTAWKPGIPPASQAALERLSAALAKQRSL